MRLKTILPALFFALFTLFSLASCEECCNQCELSVESQVVQLNAMGSPIVLVINSTSQWMIRDRSSWLSVPMLSTSYISTGTLTLPIGAEENDTPTERSGFIVLLGACGNTVTVTVRQAAFGSYTVSYHANAHGDSFDNMPDNQVKQHNVDLQLSDKVPVRSGHTFLNWNTQSDGNGIDYAPEEEYTENEDITLYAQWEPHTYTVTYDVNGGDPDTTPAQQIKLFGIPLTLTNDIPTRFGFTFEGWDTEAEGTGTHYAAGALYTQNAELMLYAQWEAIPPATYTVSFDANGGDPETTPAPQTKTHDITLTLTGDIPSRVGHTFVTWHTDPDGVMGQTYSPLGNYTDNDHITLYAQWEAIPPATYTVTFDANGGDPDTAPAPQTKTHDITLTLTGDIPSRASYSFVGWNTLSDGTGTHYASGDPYTDNDHITLFAQWYSSVPPPIIIKYLPNSGTDPVDNMPNPDEDIKLFDVDYQLSGVELLRDGFVFMRWNTEPDRSGIYYMPLDIYTGNTDLTLYAVWVYRVYYDPNGGNWSTVPAPEQEFDGNTLYLSMDEPTWSGHLFVGWNTKDDGTGTSYLPGDHYTANTSVELYAQWESLPPSSYTVTYYMTGGVSTVPPPQTKNHGVGLNLWTETEIINLVGSIPYRPSYHFAGWNTEPDYSGTTYHYGDSYDVDADLNLYAMWQDETYSIKFNIWYYENAGGGTVTNMPFDNPQLKPLGMIVNIADAPSRAGHIFLYWSTSPTDDAGSEIYHPGDPFNSERHLMLYAIWRPLEPM